MRPTITTLEELEALCFPGQKAIKINPHGIRLDPANIAPTLELRDHQLAVVPMLLISETTKLTKRDNLYQLTTAIRYSDNLGSGKTRTCLTLILLAPRPLKAYPQVLLNSSGRELVEITVKNTRPNGLLTCNIIVVKGDVIEAWKDEAARTTPSLKIFEITGIHDFKYFYRQITSVGGVGLTNRYDIILIKYGVMRNECDDIGKEVATGDADILTAVAATLKKCHVVAARVILDDYEQWPRTHKAVLPDALSYIGVSATQRTAPHASSIKVKTIADYIKSMSPTVKDFIESYALEVVNHKCDKKFIEASTRLPAIYQHKVNCVDTKGIVAALFGNTHNAHTREVMESLNGDATNTAAKLLQITATTPAAIYSALMRGTEIELEEAVARRERLGVLIGHIAAWVRSHVNEAAANVLTVETQVAIKHWINKGRGNVQDILPARGIKEVLLEYRTKIAEKEKVALSELNRVKEVLDNCTCAVCSSHVGVHAEEPNPRDGIIMQCCGKIVCRICYQEKATSIKPWWNARNNQVVIGICPMNSTHLITELSQVLYLDGKTDMNAIARSDYKNVERLSTLEAIDETIDAIDSITNDKLRALMQIVHGRVVPTAIPDEAELPSGVIVGKEYIKCTTKRKVIIFAKLAETIMNIEELFKEHKVGYIILCGRPIQIQEKINMFRDDPTLSVMLLESESHASGINLQFATDLVFYHRLADAHIERQAMGRLQRCGRICSGSIWRLLYDSE